MISESRYWKRPLLKVATWLQKLELSKDTVDRTLVRVEKELFLGFYTVRKLLETFKVSDSTRQLKFEIVWFPNIKSVDYFNAHRLHELFDLAMPTVEVRDIGFLCNQFIHSFIFSTVTMDNHIEGFFVSSDRARNERLYFIEVDRVVSIFRTVGQDYPKKAEFIRNPVTQQWEGKVG